MTDRPLTTGEGNTASEAVKWLRMVYDDAPASSTSKLRSSQVLFEHAVLSADCERLRARVDALAAAAAEYQEAVRLAGAYPGHEEYVQAEFVEIHGRLDDADMALGDRIASALAALGVEGR